MDVKTCPACHKDNPIEANTCTFCGAPLVGLLPSRTTEPVPEQPVKVRPPDRVIQLTKLYSNILVFTVLGQEQPILVKENNRTILGRYSPGESIPAVDLTPYNANLLGVSRQHAVITRSDATYELQDLDSTNGTWLNETKLVPHKPYVLRSGDLIRLGQLALYVYFDTSQPDQETTVEFNLQKPVEANQKNQLSVQEYAQYVVPYLNAIASIQGICDSNLNRDISTVGIVSMKFDSSSGQIKFKLTGGQDAVRLLKNKYIKQKIAQSVPSPEMVQSNEQANGQSSSTPPSQPFGGENTISSQQSEDLKIALEFINELSPNKMEDGDKQGLAEKLLPLMDVLTENPLKIVNGS